MWHFLLPHHMRNCQRRQEGKGWDHNRKEGEDFKVSRHEKKLIEGMRGEWPENEQAPNPSLPSWAWTGAMLLSGQEESTDQRPETEEVWGQGMREDHRECKHREVEVDAEIRGATGKKILLRVLGGRLGRQKKTKEKIQSNEGSTKKGGAIFVSSYGTLVDKRPQIHTLDLTRTQTVRQGRAAS